MKKILSVSIALLFSVSAMSVPARPGTERVKQPDGTTLTVQLHGDEYHHFTTTADGYTVVPDERGFMVYARLDQGRLMATDVIARDASERTPSDLRFLSSIEKHIAPAMSEAVSAEQKAEHERRAQARQRRVARASDYDYDNFRGLIILVEYNDRPFSRTDIRDVTDRMVNEAGYTGYDNSYYGRYTGSVRDYFHDNSDGRFTPQFDVVGPVKVNRSQFYPNSTANSAQLIMDVLNAADSEINFKEYDRDGDGIVDMVYFIFSGIGANIGGNDQRLLWPHAGQIYNPLTYNYVTKDGVYMGRYACSTELSGSATYNHLSGIGVICHEFGHVLGLPDLYDTDYEGSGGNSAHPGEWSIMAAGSYLDNERTPAGYTLYERYALGFTMPDRLTDVGHFSLPSIGSSNRGYRLDTRVNKEFFLIENRQLTDKWDAYLPNSGMLVFRCDSTNSSVWNYNNVNINPNHNYFELVRAGGKSRNSRFDPFPGAGNVRTLNNTTTPANLKSWSGRETLLGFENITETGSQITFDLVDVNILRSLTLPETFNLGVGTRRKLTETRYPDYAPYSLTWTCDNPAVATIDDDGWVTGIAEGEAVVTVSSPTQDGTLQATCTVKVEAQTMVGSIAEFKSLESGQDAWLQLNDVEVTHVYTRGKLIFVRDTTGALVLSNTGLSLRAGNRLSGQLFGRKAVVNNIPQMQGLGTQTTNSDYAVTKGATPQPRPVAIAKVDSTDYADLIKFERARIVNDGSIYAVAGDRRIRLYNSFEIKNIMVPSQIDDIRYDLTGIFYTNIADGQLIDEIELLSPDFPESDMEKFYLTYNIGQGGHVLFEGRQLTGSGTQVLFEGEDQVLTLVPNDDYEVDLVMLDGESVTGTELLFTDIANSHTLTITFGPSQMGIAQHSADGRDRQQRFFTADGRRVPQGVAPLRQGVYIVKDGRSVSKVVVK